METFDRRLTIPKRTKINNLVDKFYNDEKQKFKERLSTAHRITIGLDIWTKKGLTASFLAISACFFCTVENEAQHILLRLDQITLTLQSVEKPVSIQAQRIGEYHKKKF